MFEGALTKELFENDFKQASGFLILISFIPCLEDGRETLEDVFEWYHRIGANRRSSAKFNVLSLY